MTLASSVLGVVLLAMVGALLLVLQEEAEITDRVRAAGDTALVATETRAVVVDLQSGQRGYLLTRDRRFLEPYEAARDRWRALRRDERFAALGPVRGSVRRQIDSLISDYLERTITLFPRDPERVRLTVASGLGKRRVDRLRAELGRVIDTARAARVVAFDDLDDAERTARALAGSGIVAGALLIVLFTVYLARAIVVPVRRVAIAAGRMSGGDLGARAGGTGRGSGEIADMARSFDQMADDLAARSAALEARYREVRVEVDRAAGLQRRLLPDGPPSVRGLDLAGACLPAADVGGDLFDFVVDREGRVTLVVADVAGHGIAASLVMAMVRQVIRRGLLRGEAPADVLRTANDELFDDLASVELFVTAFVARVHQDLGLLEFANAGHNLPLLRRADGRLQPLDADGAALGIIPGVEFETGSVPWGPGDAVVLYTDGVVEAEDAAGRPLGDEGLRTLAASLDDGEAGAAVDRVVDAVRRHVGERPPHDDVTVVVGRATSP